MSIRKEEKGQILVEVMVALAITLISLTGFLGLLRTSFALNSVASKNYTAAYLASEGVEIVKHVVDRTFFDTNIAFNEGVGEGCYEVQYNSTALNGINCNNPQEVDMKYGSGEYRRKVEIEYQEGGDVMHVISTVSWEEKGDDYSVVVEDYFYHWWDI